MHLRISTRRRGSKTYRYAQLVQSYLHVTLALATVGGVGIMGALRRRTGDLLAFFELKAWALSGLCVGAVIHGLRCVARVVARVVALDLLGLRNNRIITGAS